MDDSAELNQAEFLIIKLHILPKGLRGKVPRSYWAFKNICHIW